MSKDATLAARLSAVGDELRSSLAIWAVCVGALMVVLDATVVSVTLPSIREDLRLTETSLVWVVNAYALAYSGTLLLGGRLGDLYGPRRLFLLGIAFFTMASATCGLASTGMLLFVARAVQGLAGAVVVAVSLALITNMAKTAAERAKAMGAYSFICACGGGIGLLLGGSIASALNWHWIFLINLPVGILVYALCFSILPRDRSALGRSQLDIPGAITMAAAVIMALYAVSGASTLGWASVETLTPAVCAAMLLLLFLLIQIRVRTPLIPLGIFRRRNLATVTSIGVLWGAGASTWFFTAALYMQLVLGYDPMQVAMAFLPANVLSGLFGLSFSPKLVSRFGVKAPIVVGLALGALGLALFARAPIDGVALQNVVPSMILLGLGTGIAFNPLLVATMSDVGPDESGLVSGIFNTTSMFGGALGLATFTSLSALRDSQLTAGGAGTLEALLGGYHVAFFAGAVCVGMGALLGLMLREARK